MDAVSAKNINVQNLLMLAKSVEQTADHVMITDKEGVIEYVNAAFEKTTGYSKQDVLWKTPKILQSGQHTPEYYQKLWTTILSGQVFYAQTTNKKKNGEVYVADQSIAPVYGGDGKITHFISVWKDVTQRIATQEKLKHLNEQLVIEKKKLEQVLSIEARLHSISDLHKLIDFVTQKTCEVLETKKCSIMFVDEESGELCVRGHHGIEESRIGESLLRMGGQIEDLIELHRTREAHHDSFKGHGSLKIDGTVYQSEHFLSVPIKIGEHLLGMINVSDKKRDENSAFTDLDLKILSLIARQTKVAIENAKLYQNLKYLTVIDPLTGIYNYRHFTQTLDYELMRAKRYQRGLSLLMMDIDQLKSYNDTFGHLEGDKLLKSVAECIKENVRQTDEVCRYGGDEFVVILPETDLGQAKITAEKIRQKILGIPLMRPVTVSIGVTQCTAHTDRHSLVRRADTALYTAKGQGKNRVFG